jgi:hypothetical protein
MELDGKAQISDHAICLGVVGDESVQARGEMFLSHRPIPKLEDHTFSAVNTFAVIPPFSTHVGF